MFKHSQIMAHSSNVNCFRFGRRSGQVAVSGGDDTNVNVWRLRDNETKNIMSLAGHSSPVECVIFDPTEKKVVAGAKSGAIKAYDMESAKVFRTLKGHMSNCTTIDYHMYGDYVASGALDTNVKIWDLKTKNCVQTFKGHKTEVTCVGFTPDGRWLTSGGADGSLKIWDLTAGKLLHEFTDHNGAIVCLEFNPEEYIMVSSSTDKTVRFWDVEAFQLLGLTPTDSGVTTCIAHTMSEPYSGKYALCSSQDMIKVWSYESSVKCHDQLAWNRDSMNSQTLGDTFVTDNLQLFGASFANAFVSIWRVDLNQMEPFAPPNTAKPMSTPSGPRPVNTPLSGPRPVNTPPSGPRSVSTPPAKPQTARPPPQEPEVTNVATQMGIDTVKRFSIDLSPPEPVTVIHPEPVPAEPEEAQPVGDYIKELRCGMEVSLRTLRSRQKCLEQFMTYWEKGDVHGGFRFMSQLPVGTREAMTKDILAAVDFSTVGLDLEACVLLLPLASELVATPASDSYIATGIAVAKQLVAMFGPLVRDNRDARKNSREVNFASEERAMRCDACHREFVELRNRSQKLLESNCRPMNVVRELNEFRAMLAEYCWTP
ncbi:WD repeat-containing protein 90 [Aphanomyces cochlioides]|nr:WD repeat-containing protein 90 [Aphanomyces cochlioides]